MLFQQGALFSSLTALQNVQFPMREYLRLSPRLMDEIALAKLEMVGLRADVRGKYPAELSGGMIKRVALARALALDPDIVFLDEPTSGLDPIGAAEFDELIRTLQQTLGLSVFMVTHDLDSLHAVCDRIAVLSEGRVIATGPIDAMLASEHPWLRSYFGGKRGRQVSSLPAEPCIIEVGRERTQAENERWKPGPAISSPALSRSRSSPACSAFSTGCRTAPAAAANVRSIAWCSPAPCPACGPAPRCCSTACGSAK